jgi:hypothetical protein
MPPFRFNFGYTVASSSSSLKETFSPVKVELHFTLLKNCFKKNLNLLYFESSCSFLVNDKKDINLNIGKVTVGMFLTVYEDWAMFLDENLSDWVI